MMQLRRLIQPYGRSAARYYLILCCLLLPVLAFSQEATFTVSFGRIDMEQALIRLRAVTGASIAFSQQEVKGIPVGPIDFKSQPTENILKGLLKDQSFTIERKGTAWLVRKAAVKTATPVKIADTTVTDNARVSALKEIVVLGFGQTQKKIAQTGAIASITTKEIKQSPVANIANALAGRLPGLISVQHSGEPGKDMPDLYIRGMASLTNNAPLITIDGIQKEYNTISLLDPNEVESVTILKDASATALYGVKGANGVIIIQTKRGTIGKPVINASVQTSIQEATALPQYVNSYQFATLANEAYRNDNPTGTLIPYSDAQLQGYKDNKDPYRFPNVDWLHEMLQPAKMTRADFNISGGVPMAKYFVNVGYTQQDGLYKAEKNDQYDPHLIYKRYNFRSNIDVNFDEDFSMGLSLFGAIENKNSPYTSTYDLFDYLLKTPPNQFPVKYPTGFYGGTFRSNPFHLLNETGFTQSFNSSLSGMLTATRKLDFITKGLYIKGNYSFDGYFTNNFTRQKFERTALYKGTGDLKDSASYVYDGNDQPLAAPVSAYSETRDVWTDLSLNYQRDFGAHSVSGLLLANRTQQVIGGQIPFVSQGLVSRITYNYRDKYFAEFNAGFNGTDNFAKGKRYGFFPAVSAGWVISSEPFLSTSNVVDFLKLRGSYGLTGNDQIPGRRWLFVSEYKTGSPYNYGDPLVKVGGVQEGPMANADVTWEKAHKLNIGLEAKLWKELLGVTLDVFREKRNDILITRGSVPALIGVSPANLPPANMGEVVNRGFELELTHRNKIGQVTYFLRGNGSYVKNKILFMDEVSYPYSYLSRTGKTIGQLFGLTSIGFFKDKEDITKSPVQFGNVIPGDLKYKDLNNDGVIDANDQGPIGKSNVPEIMFGFSGGMSWKHFDMSFLFQGAADYNIIFQNEAAYEFYNGGSVLVQHLGRWTPATADQATYPVLHYGINSNNHRASSFYMKDASYLRLKNLEVGYTFKQVNMTKHTGFSNIRIFLNGANLYTWDRMGKQSFDPEAPNGNGFYYPQVKTFNAGISTEF
jgi:TonB-linked SusC/RagA family outer membrane protein